MMKKILKIVGLIFIILAAFLIISQLIQDYILSKPTTKVYFTIVNKQTKEEICSGEFSGIEKKYGYKVFKWQNYLLCRYEFKEELNGRLFKLHNMDSGETKDLTIPVKNIHDITDDFAISREGVIALTVTHGKDANLNSFYYLKLGRDDNFVKYGKDFDWSNNSGYKIAFNSKNDFPIILIQQDKSKKLYKFDIDKNKLAYLSEYEELERNSIYYSSDSLELKLIDTYDDYNVTFLFDSKGIYKQAIDTQKVDKILELNKETDPWYSIRLKDSFCFYGEEHAYEGIRIYWPNTNKIVKNVDCTKLFNSQVGKISWGFWKNKFTETRDYYNLPSNYEIRFSYLAE